MKRTIIQLYLLLILLSFSRLNLGNVHVVKAGPEFKLLAKNALKDICMATPAISGDVLYFRTQHFVIAVE